MIGFLLRRLLFALVLTIVTSSAALLLSRLAPGDMTAQLGPFASRSEVEQTRERFDLNRSPAAQLALWMGRAARLEFGESFLYNRPVRELVAGAAVNTSILGIVALALATIAGLSLGLAAGLRASSSFSTLMRGVSLVLISTPPLITSLTFVFVAARTGWLPTGGMLSPGAAQLGWAAWLGDLLWHLPIPALALALPMAATFERLQAQTIGEAVRQPFVLAAVARGVARRRVILRHAWPASVAPICAVYGVAIGALLSGSFIVEFITAWPGLGRLMFEALRARDVYLVAGCAAAGAACLAVGTTVSDLLLALADPRVRR